MSAKKAVVIQGKMESRVVHSDRGFEGGPRSWSSFEDRKGEDSAF